MTTKTRVLVLVCFLVTFASGAAVGLLASRLARSKRPGSWLAQRLNLRPEQRKQMHKIWSRLQRTSRRQVQAQRETLNRERAKAVRALLTQEQKEKYDDLVRQRSAKLARLARQREARFKAAVERTKQILNEQQRQQYEELLKDRAKSRKRPGPFGGRPGVPGTQRAAPPRRGGRRTGG
jgi:Spy/CpxP family protein refolding chaperone